MIYFHPYNFCSMPIQPEGVQLLSAFTTKVKEPVATVSLTPAPAGGSVVSVVDFAFSLASGIDRLTG